MEFVEAEGNSIDEAIARALELLGVSRDKVDVDILSNATRGVFGFGGRRAKVRATVRRRLAVDDGAAAGTPPVAETPRPAASRAAEQRPAAPVPITPSGRAPARPPRAPRRAPGTAAGAARAKSERPPPRPATAAPRSEAREMPPIDAASLERARTILGEMVRLLGSEATVEPAPDPDGVHLVIRGDPSGVLIGRRGQTLDAIEYLLNRIMAHEDDGGGGSRLVVDAEGYRQRRRQALEDLARRVAERARRRGKPVTLNPMSPRDRRIVHLTLQDDPDLTTRSAGSGFYRKVVIVPEGSGSRRR
jgi:spoIIIJ-associated protein